MSNVITFHMVTNNHADTLVTCLNITNTI